MTGLIKRKEKGNSIRVYLFIIGIFLLGVSLSTFFFIYQTEDSSPSALEFIGGCNKQYGHERWYVETRAGKTGFTYFCTARFDNSFNDTKILNLTI